MFYGYAADATDTGLEIKITAKDGYGEEVTDNFILTINSKPTID